MQMVTQSKTPGTSRKSWITIGILLIVVLLGASGCGTSPGTSAPATSQTQSNQGQASQGKRTSNPALQAVMNIRRLQSNQVNALTSDQKDKIKPILQELISTANPTQVVLQQKADAINAVLTAQQKSFLAQPKTNANNANGNSSRRNNPQGGGGTGGGTGRGPGGGSGGNQNGSAFNPQTMYQQALDSLK